MSPKDALAHWPAPSLKLPELSAGLYLAEARRRLERLAAVDPLLSLSRSRAVRADRWAEAQHWRLAEAWKHTQANAQEFERHLRDLADTAGRCWPAAPRSLELLRAELLTHYCANILKYQAAAGKQPGAPARAVPVEWMQMAAAAAILSVIQTALVLWVLHRPTRRRVSAARRRPPVVLVSGPRWRPPAAPALALPLRL